LGLLVNKKRLL